MHIGPQAAPLRGVDYRAIHEREHILQANHFADFYTHSITLSFSTRASTGEFFAPDGGEVTAPGT
jgi:hypothetical protein